MKKNGMTRRDALKMGAMATAGMVCSLGVPLFIGERKHAYANNKQNIADIAIVNAVIFTSDEKRTIAEAMAIKGDTIIYVGTRESLKPFLGNETEVMDFKGGTILPGMVDAHCHPIMTTLWTTLEMSLWNSKTLDEVKNTIKAYMAKHPEYPAYTGAGYPTTLFGQQGPHKSILDELCPDKPMFILSSEGHATWANTKALEYAGYTKDTPDPKGGVIVKDPVTGEPTGTLREKAGGPPGTRLGELRRKATLEEHKEVCRIAQKLFLSQGLTSVADMFMPLDHGYAEAYDEMARDGSLKLKVRGFWSLTTDSFPADDFIAKAKEPLERQKKFTHPHFKALGFKLYADQVLEEFASFLKEPYAFNKDDYGMKIWLNEADLLKVMLFLDKQGADLHFHQTGNAAAAYVLDAMEKVVAINGQRDRHFSFGHCQFIDDVDKDRIAKLGATTVVPPYWCTTHPIFYWDKTVYGIGEQRAATQYPIQSLTDHGINVAVHSDYCVSLPNWGHAIFMSMHRIMPKSGFDSMFPAPTDIAYTLDFNAKLSPKVTGPLPTKAECTTMEQAIVNATINGAKMLRMNDDTGSIEVGKKADIVGFKENIFKAAPQVVADMQPLFTMIDGETVYKQENAEKMVEIVTGLRGLNP